MTAVRPYNGQWHEDKHACHCESPIARGAKRNSRNSGLLPVRHSRGSGNPVFCSWIPGLALLARNDGRVVLVIPAQAGIQGRGILFLSSDVRSEAISDCRGDCFVARAPRNDLSLSANGKSVAISTLDPFALSCLKGERGVFQQPEEKRKNPCPVFLREDQSHSLYLTSGEHLTSGEICGISISSFKKNTTDVLLHHAQ